VILIGTAGWSYPDWDGCVYPARRPPGFDPLAHLARFLDCIEINASFYRIPDPRTSSSWVERVSGRSGFRFTAKIWRGFTHEPASGPEEAAGSERAFRAFIEPLREAGILGAVLVQFPYSFHRTSEGWSRLSDLIERFEDLPLVVEVRHASWVTLEFLAALRERGVAFCNVDQPAISANILPTAHVTAPLAYVRLHGRNAGAWFEEGAGRDRRYDYLYTAEEISGWVDRIASMAAGARDLIVIANNHYRGQAVANALELKAALAGGEVEAPSEILAAYPRLAGKVRVLSPPVGPQSPSQGVLPFR